MLITLHCGGMKFNSTTIEEKSLGGSESAAYYMAEELAKLGNKVTLFTTTDEESISSGGVKYVPMGAISNEHPLGEIFHYYAESSPTDVMIIQRHPKAFAYKWASKVNIWWIHDLALMQNRNLVQDMMWNVDRVLTVSEWHRDQVIETYGLNPSIVSAITNGVDLSLFDTSKPIKNSVFSKHESLTELKKIVRLLYTSRPERGLENLVKPGGIMEKLYETHKDYHLYVCGYDNTVSSQRGYYEHLFERCDTLPNVTNLGALTKQELADVMRQCNLHVYPSTFEETSCITAMECMAAGLPMVACHVGGLYETTKNAGVELTDLTTSGELDEFMFLNAIKNNHANSFLGEKQLAAAPYYSWEKAAERMLLEINECFINARTSEASIVKELIRKSDFYAIKDAQFAVPSDSIMNSVHEELNICYDFTKANSWDEHYANYYQYEQDRGINYGPEDLSNNHRFMHVASLIRDLPADSTILDYGCAHGHYTINLAKAFPDKYFIGLDITPSNIEKAQGWATEEGLSNIEFSVGRVEGERLTRGFLLNEEAPTEETPTEALSTLDSALFQQIEIDCIIAAEVLEHVADPQNHVNVLQRYLSVDGLMIVTTPYGPWEAQGFKEHWPWRAHVHHFEREDLSDMWGSFRRFNVVNIPSGMSPQGEAMGSYVTSWNNEKLDSGSIDYKRKLELVAPRQTISCCMIVKDASSSIKRCLESVVPHVDEVIIGFDEDCDTDTKLVVSKYLDSCHGLASDTFTINSPTKIGFDAARNSVINHAAGEWILWIDADEFLHGGEFISQYLRCNQYNGYAISQHHFSMQPVGVLKTDLPVRIFRNNEGIKFFGKVHEHPEQELNEGVGFVTVLDSVSILHDGYKDESVRRGRFSRNIDLLKLDREMNPERILGKYLWLRDLAQTSVWELEARGGQITTSMLSKVDEGIELWRELLEKGEVRIVVDSLEFYSSLCRIKGNCFEMDVRIDTNKYGSANSNEVKPIKAFFNCREDAKALLNLVFDERTKLYEGKYS